MLGKKLKKLLPPLVQLLPAVLVTTIVLVTLPGTAPVLAEVPQRLEPAAESTVEPAAQEPEPKASVLPRLPYADGVYTGSSRGYGGTVKVQVTMEDGYISALEILDASHETSAFFRRARRLLKTVLSEQTWEVDAVSEATYTSRGILGAIKNALTGEVVINPLPPQPKPAAPLVEGVFEEPSAYIDGVYTASADGFGGPIIVQVTVAGDAITDITIVSYDGETGSYFARGRKVVSRILESGTPVGVDAVSGATYSSTGILNAVKQALAKAANTDAVEQPAAELPADSVEEPAASSAPEEAPDVMQPTVEVVHPEEPKSAFDWITDLWDALFPEQSGEPASSVTGEGIGEAAASESEAAPETAEDTPAGPEPPDSVPETEKAAAETEQEQEGTAE